MKGTVKRFVGYHGYGFIIGEDEKNYFVHVSDIEDHKELNAGQKVSFEPSENQKGLIAKKVKLEGE